MTRDFSNANPNHDGTWLHIHRSGHTLQPMWGGAKVIILDGRGITNQRTLLDAIAEALALPGYFGRNWDALADCLGDLSWLPADGYGVVWTDASRLLLHSPDDWDTFLDVFAGASRWWRSRGVSMELHVVDPLLFRVAGRLAGAILHP